MEDNWERLKEVPENLVGYRAIALRWLIEKSDGDVFILRKPKGKSRYRVYLDDGAYKGGWNLEFSQENLTPLNVITRVANTTRWPGHISKLSVIEKFAEELMAKEPRNDA